MIKEDLKMILSKIIAILVIILTTGIIAERINYNSTIKYIEKRNKINDNNSRTTKEKELS